MISHTSSAEKTCWIIASLLLVVASVALSLRFWTAAAYSDRDLFSHICIALAAHAAYYGSLATAVASFRAGLVPRALLACFAALVCFALNCIAQTGAYAFQEASAHADAAAIAASSDAAREQAETAHSDADAARQALQGQLATLDAELARLQAQSADFSAKGMITKGTAIIEPQIANARASREQVAAQLASIRSDAPSTGFAPSVNTNGRNAFTSFFDTLAAFTGRSPEKLRAVFFILLPPVHEFLAGCAAICLASIVTVRRREEPEEPAEEFAPDQAVLNAFVPEPTSGDLVLPRPSSFEEATAAAFTPDETQDAENEQELGTSSNTSQEPAATASWRADLVKVINAAWPASVGEKLKGRDAVQGETGLTANRTGTIWKCLLTSGLCQIAGKKGALKTIAVATKKDAIRKARTLNPPTK